MFKNILLPYDFENDFSAIPDYLEKVTDEDSVVVIYHVVTENDLAISVKSVSYTHLTLPTTRLVCRCRWSAYD